MSFLNLKRLRNEYNDEENEEIFAWNPPKNVKRNKVKNELINEIEPCVDLNTDNNEDININDSAMSSSKLNALDKIHFCFNDAVQGTLLNDKTLSKNPYLLVKLYSKCPSIIRKLTDFVLHKSLEVRTFWFYQSCMYIKQLSPEEKLFGIDLLSNIYTTIPEENFFNAYSFEKNMVNKVKNKTRKKLQSECDYYIKFESDLGSHYGFFALALDDERKLIRNKILDLIGNIASQKTFTFFAKKTFHYVIELLNDEEESIRVQTIKCLAKVVDNLNIVEDEYLEIIYFNLKDKNKTLRTNLYMFLSKIKFTERKSFSIFLNTLIDNVRIFDDYFDIMTCLQRSIKLQIKKNTYLNLIDNSILKPYFKFDGNYLLEENDWKEVGYHLSLLSWLEYRLELNNSHKFSGTQSSYPRFLLKHCEYLSSLYPNFFMVCQIKNLFFKNNKNIIASHTQSPKIFNNSSQTINYNRLSIFANYLIIIDYISKPNYESLIERIKSTFTFLLILDRILLTLKVFNNDLFKELLSENKLIVALLIKPFANCNYFDHFGEFLLISRNRLFLEHINIIEISFIRPSTYQKFIQYNLNKSFNCPIQLLTSVKFRHKLFKDNNIIPGQYLVKLSNIYLINKETNKINTVAFDLNSFKAKMNNNSKLIADKVTLSKILYINIESSFECSYELFISTHILTEILQECIDINQLLSNTNGKNWIELFSNSIRMKFLSNVPNQSNYLTYLLGYIGNDDKCIVNISIK